MKIRSDYLTEGLFGQIFVWMLEILPYVDRNGWQPSWEILSRNYGTPPSFNLFPEILSTVYPATNDDSLVEDFERLQKRHKHNFRHDFGGAHKAWASHFRFPQEICSRLEEFWNANFANDVVLGIHYRGTDKNVDPWQTNPVSKYQFICVVEDFLQQHPDVTAIFVASDDATFVEAMSAFSKVRCHTQTRSTNSQPVWNQHDASHNQSVARDAILDSLTLSKCRYGLKCMSQLSAFSKVFNPTLEIYRISACKPGWFPEAYIPRYTSHNKAVSSLLRVLQQDDFQSSQFNKLVALPRRLTGIRNQWKRRSTHAFLAGIWPFRK